MATVNYTLPYISLIGPSKFQSNNLDLLNGISLNSENKLFNTNPFDYTAYFYKKWTTKPRGLSYVGFQQEFKNWNTQFLNLYFGPTGPGYNYGGATSDYYNYTQLNNNNPVPMQEILYYRQLYNNTINGTGVTLGSLKNNFLFNQFKNLNTQASTSISTPGIAGLIGNTPPINGGDRIG